MTIKNLIPSIGYMSSCTLLTCSISLCPVRSDSMVCGRNDSHFVETKPLLKQNPVEFFSDDINLVHVPKGGLDYCKI